MGDTSAKPINEIQALMDGMSAAWQRERATTQMTLGELIARLESIQVGRVQMLCKMLLNPHSYRGYYCDLAFERGDGWRGGTFLLDDCRRAMGAGFEGYKGGTFYMTAATPVWVAKYGECGERLMAITDAGEIETAPEEASDG